MGDVVSLHGPQIDLASDLGRELIVDLSRFYEELLSEAAIRKKYRFDDKTWEALGSDDRLVEMVEAEKTRRIRTGEAKREKAQVLITKAPGILDSIMSDPSASPRHRVDAIKTLDTFTTGPGATAPAGDRFIIQINLGADVERYSKSIKVDPTDEDPFNPTPPEVLAAIAAKKNEGDGGDNL